MSGPRLAVLGILAFMLAYSLGVLAIPIQATDLNQPSSTISILIAVPGISSLITLGPALTLQHMVSNRVSLAAASSFLSTAGLALLGQTLTWLLASAALLGVAAALFWPTALTALSESEDEAYQGYGALAQGLAGLAAGLLVAIFAVAGGVPGAAIIVLGLAGILIGSLVATPRTEERRGGFREEFGRVLRRSGALLRSSASLMSSLATFPFSLLWWVGGTSFMTLYVLSLDLPVSFAGALVAVRAATATGLRVAYAPVARRVGPLGVWVLGSLLAAFGMLIVPFFTSPAWLIGCAVLQGIGLSVVLPAANSLAARATTPADRTIGYALPFATAQAVILTMPIVLGGVAAAEGLGPALIAAGLIATFTTVGLGVVAAGLRPPVRLP